MENQDELFEMVKSLISQKWFIVMAIISLITMFVVLIVFNNPYVNLVYFGILFIVWHLVGAKKI